MGPERERSAGRPRTELLVFDGDCGFCTWAAGWVQRRLPSGAGVEPWQFIDDLGRYGLAAADVSTAAYWIDAGGRPHRGHLAFAEALRAMSPGWRLVGTAMRVPPISWLAALMYELVARFRHLLPGSTPACRTWRRSDEHSTPSR
jgi:predicted DCC family thiol-disulfide oxidoreductase YuxK